MNAVVYRKERENKVQMMQKKAEHFLIMYKKCKVRVQR